MRTKSRFFNLVLNFFAGFIYHHVPSGPPPPITGLHVDYNVGEMIGSGGFAIVYRAVHRESGRWRAVKVIGSDKTVLRHGRAQKRANDITREINVMGQLLSHRNICSLINTYHQPDGTVSIVMELVEGGNLAKYVKATRDGLGSLFFGV